MSDPDALPRQIVRLYDLPTRRATTVLLEPNASERAAIAKALGIVAIKKLRFSGELTPLGKTDWQLSATLGATVVQECVVTLAPVTTRIDEPLHRSYLADLPDPEPGETEMPDDDSVEPLPSALDLAEVMIEALALALPPYPRAQGVPPAEISVTEPGKQAMTDDEAKPFAGLAALRGKLAEPPEDQND